MCSSALIGIPSFMKTGFTIQKLTGEEEEGGKTHKHAGLRLYKPTFNFQNKKIRLKIKFMLHTKHYVSA
jgi:hypothetical protein